METFPNVINGSEFLAKNLISHFPNDAHGREESEEQIVLCPCEITKNVDGPKGLQYFRK